MDYSYSIISVFSHVHNIKEIWIHTAEDPVLQQSTRSYNFPQTDADRHEVFKRLNHTVSTLPNHRHIHKSVQTCAHRDGGRGFI